MIKRLTEIVQRAAGTRVLLVGDLILDRYVYGDAERISPEAPVPVLRAVDRHDRVGGSANVAACLRALNVEVTCCGAIGPDASGRRLRSMLDELGVDAGGCVVTEDRDTTTKTRFVGLAQHRHRQQLLRLDEESAETLPAPVASRLRDLAVAALADADVVCIEDYQKGVISRPLIETLVTEARTRNIPVLVDPARVGDYALYAGATLLTPNRSELEHAAGISFPSPDAVIEHAPSLLERWNIDALVVTLDREGAVVLSRTAPPHHVPTRPRSVYDNTGAGDAVVAALAAALAAGASLDDAARIANTAGGLEVEKFGCVPIAADEILADLRIEHRRRNGKLRTVDELQAELTLRRDRGETVVFTNGVYDILHPGHVQCLTAAREFGSLLVVAINSDASVKRLNKGDDRPINDERFRAAMLGAMECVDYVAVFDESEPTKLIERLRPDVLVKGADWIDKGVVGREIVERNGGRVETVTLVDGYSTTSIIDRIRNGRRP